MKLYRKKPVLIQAVQLRTELQAAAHEGVCTCKRFDGKPHIHTLEGTHMWATGDWLIKGVAGEYYFCKPDIFAATYEEYPAD